MSIPEESGWYLATDLNGVRLWRYYERSENVWSVGYEFKQDEFYIPSAFPYTSAFVVEWRA